MPIAGGWSGRRSGTNTAICSRRWPPSATTAPQPHRAQLGWRPSVPDPGTAPSDQPAASRRHDRRRRDHAARDRLPARPGTRLLRRRRGSRPAGRSAPRANAGLGGGGAQRRARTSVPRRRVRPSQRPPPELPLDRWILDRWPRLGRQLWAGGARPGRRDRHGTRPRDWSTAAALLDQVLPAARDLPSPARRRPSCWGVPRSTIPLRADARARCSTLLAHRDCTTGSGATRRPTGPGRRSSVTYENALLPRALIVAGRVLDLGADGRTPACVSLDWLIDAQTSPDGHLSPVGNEWWPRGGEMSHFDQQPIEATALLLAAEVRPRSDRRRTLRGGDGALVRVVPRCQRPRPLRGGSSARRVLRRPHRTGRQHERGSRVHADVADRSRAHPGLPRPIQLPPRRSHGPLPRRRPGDQTGAALSARPREPHPVGGRRPVSGELGLQSCRRSRRQRDDPPRPRGGPPRDLPAPRGPQRRTASRTGDSIPSRSSRRTSIGIPRRPGAARIRGSPGCPSARSGRSPTRPTAAAGRSSGSRPPVTSGASVASGRSCHRRTRTPPSSLAGSTVAGR